MKRLGNFVTTYPKLIIGLWSIFFVITAILAIQLPSKLEGDGFTVEGDHSAVTDELTTTFNLPKETIFVVFDNKTDAEISAVMEKLTKYEPISSLQSPLEQPNLYKNQIAYAILNFDKDVENISAIVTELRDMLEKEENVAITGGPVLSNDISAASQKDLMNAEAIGLPIALIVLLLAFGSVVASVLPILVGIFSVVGALGIMTLIGDTFTLSIFVLNIVPMLGLALTIDFALLFINRYREERSKSTVEEAVKTTIQTAGRSIVFSAACVMIGLGAMIVIKVDIFQNIALGGTLAVGFAVVGGLTLLPALICVLKDKLNKWTIVKVKTNTSRWERFAGFVMKHPIKIILAATIALGIGIVPIKDLTLTIPSVDALPTSFDSRAAFEKLHDEFNLTDNTVVYFLAEREEGWVDEAGLTALFDIQKEFEDDPLVTNVSTIFSETQLDSVAAWQQSMTIPQVAAQLEPLVDTFIQDKQLFIPITIETESTTKEAKEWIYHWMDEDLGVAFKLGGPAKFNQEIFDETADKIMIAIAIILVSTFIILMLAFQSILIPLKAILMNVIGLGATFGILVYIFQYGHFGLEAGTISLIIPVITFCVVFGLSMDYEVFLISRIQEEYHNGHSNTNATINGLAKTSKIITSAALIMIVLTGAFAFTDVVPVKQIGVSIAIAVAIDATIIRLLLVPSLMKLLGDWNWWMPFRKVKKVRSNAS